MMDGIDEPYNVCRQILPKIYLHNGYLDAVTIETLLKGSISGDKILPYIMDKCDKFDIDNIEEWNGAEKYMSDNQ